MQLTDVRVSLCTVTPQAGFGGSRLRAFCSLTFDRTFVVRDVKLIEGDDGLFLAMPSRKICDHCPHCSEKNHLRARFCNQCGKPLDSDRHLRLRPAMGRVKLHADVAHPINARCRQHVERQVFAAYATEVERSKLPGYVPTNLDPDDFDLYDPASSHRNALHRNVQPMQAN